MVPRGQANVWRSNGSATWRTKPITHFVGLIESSSACAATSTKLRAPTRHNRVPKFQSFPTVMAPTAVCCSQKGTQPMWPATTYFDRKSSSRGNPLSANFTSVWSWHSAVLHAGVFCVSFKPGHDTRFALGGGEGCKRGPTDSKVLHNTPPASPRLG